MYDLAIIGSGPAGITCAKKALKHKLKTVIIEKDPQLLGGVCLNQGCIPTKFLLKASNNGRSWEDCTNGSQELIKKIKSPLIASLEKQGISFSWGTASFLNNQTLKVEGREIKARYIIVAGGSAPKNLINHSKVVFAQDLFNLKNLPDKILIAGAGAVGIEFGCLLQNFKKDVLLIEKENRILPGFDSYLSQRLQVILRRRGLNIKTAQNITEYNLDDFDLVVSALGRKPNIESLQLENAGIHLDENGWINTDKFTRTNVENVFTCGDINGKKLYAYTAEYQAEICIKNIMGKTEEEDYRGLPECVFSCPQIAQAGILEAEAKQKNIKYTVIKSNFLKFSSAYVYGDTDGFIKLIFDEQERIIGAGIISELAAELINMLSLCIKNNLKLSDIKKCQFIHPTLSEIILALAHNL